METADISGHTHPYTGQYLIALANNFILMKKFHLHKVEFSKAKLILYLFQLKIQGTKEIRLFRAKPGTSLVS